MIAELGHAALWLAVGMVLLQLAGPLSRRPGWAGIAGPAAMAQAWFLIAAVLALLWSFAVTDLSVTLVNDTSHGLKPLGERLTDIARPGGGRLLLTALVLALVGGIAAFRGEAVHVIGWASLIALVGSVAVDPFARLDIVPAQGRSYPADSPLPFLVIAAVALVLLSARTRWIWGGFAGALVVGGLLIGLDPVRRSETAATLRVGDRVDVGPLTVLLADLRPAAGPGHTAVVAQLVVWRDGKAVSSLHPEHRTLIYPGGDASPVAVALIGANAVSARVTSTGTDSATLGLIWHPVLP